MIAKNVIITVRFTSNVVIKVHFVELKKISEYIWTLVVHAYKTET